jgi:pimeloyl-ACP methyl ester carboxylesterase
MTPFEMPWTPPGEILRIEGRGEFFLRHHRHPEPGRPTVLLLHGWTASSDLQFVTAYRGLSAEFNVVGVDHRGHGRGLRSPDTFELEDVVEDAAAVCRALGVGRVVAVGYSMGGPLTLLLARRHPELVAGVVLQATAMEWRATRWERVKWGFLTLAGPWLRSRGHRWYLRRSVPKLFDVESEWRPYVPWMISELSRNDPHAVVEAGRALSRYDARPWAGTLGLPAGVLVTTKDRLVRPSKQRAQAEVLRATVRELAADHLAPLTDADEYTRLTVELVAVVASSAQTAAAAPLPSAESSVSTASAVPPMPAAPMPVPPPGS